MFTDVVGYTILSQRNEALALELLEEHRRQVRPFFPRYNGKEIKTMGDAFLVEFASALEAIRCAFDIQRSLNELNADRPLERRVYVRIGIHLGDVIHSGNDIHGDAVNIASRIESLAEPGGICVTEQVYDQTRNKFEFPFVALGRHELKNIQLLMKIYKIGLPWEKGEVAGSGLDKHRIAIMPLVNITGDSKDEYFTDGMTEELISAISNISELSVISRTSAMKFKGGGKTVGEIGRELKVGTLLEGSVRKSDDRIRITVQLIDVDDDKHIWSQNHDRKLGDIFSIQSEIAQRIADTLKVKLLAKEKDTIENRQTGNQEAYTLYLHGRYHWNKRTEEGLKKAVEYFKKAIEIDPSYAMAYSGIADSYFVQAEWYPRVETLRRAKEYAIRAVELNDKLPEAHTSLAAILFQWDWDWTGSEREFKTSIELNPNYPTARHWYAFLLEALGRFDEAISEIRRAEELDPLSLVIGAGAARVLMSSGKYDEALKQAKRLMEVEPNFYIAHLALGSTYASMKMYDQAIEEIRAALSLEPGSAFLKAFLGSYYGKAGRIDETKRILGELLELSKTSYVSSLQLAELYAVLGKEGQMFECLGRALEEHVVNLGYLRINPNFAQYRDDPRFANLMKRMGLYD